ncbi:MAG TPA: hypothetical protein VFJ58_10265 [Armatimonadota bacterium]|nr:hypothetical protein [Armatimonadota bacterium]
MRLQSPEALAWSVFEGFLLLERRGIGTTPAVDGTLELLLNRHRAPGL